MKKSFLILCSLLMTTGVFAQLSTGEVNANVIPRTGNRPQAGDMGFYLGASVTQVMDLINYNKNVKGGESGYGQWYWALPAMNFKYYMTDNWEARIGLESSCYSKTTTSKMKDDKYSSSTNYNYTRFLPGAAYHFNTNNILDVYVGAQVPIGFNVNSEKNKMPSGRSTTSQNAFVIGAGVFAGFQVFIADLPFAIGLELGYSGKATLGGASKTVTVVDGDRTVSVGGVNFDKYTHASGTWGADAALTFSYYFHK